VFEDIELHSLFNLEMHLTHACNLTCESCSHYSNQGHKGIVSLEDADRQMALWDQRLSPQFFSLLGGEPTIHPRLPEFVALCRRHWPNAALRLVTNGFFLHRHPTLPVVMREVGNACLFLSIHHASPEYQEKLRPVYARLGDWVRRYGVEVRTYESARGWTRRYKGFGAAMEPFEDGQPRRSWEECPAKYCRQLFDGKIYKCAPAAYLKMQDEKYGLLEKWKPYLAYRSLESDCSAEELRAFFAREEEPCCGMCPASPERMELPLPLPGRSTRGAEKTPLPILEDADPIS
jgi:hypothetical protein